ncbi:thermonuclease family protein [Actinomycetospora cinnamomea]|uniref:Endonuclease YncB(Thermonuclease family) n=1 Tax=Actinomycetospora cinnamomea TaxID=663609 RepID=A0A2U1F0Y2_9PSEU|nr:thermonuclease family protein [Actinomycetospora cinnamomea]PVZ05847.1 endonuclease YncB(thermonuclease family) [Actinomycetospora cinnamomea]
MSRAALARLLLGVAVAVCAAAAVVTLTTAHVPTAPVAAPVTAPAPDPAAALTGLAAAPPGERAVVARVVDAVTFDARLPDGGPVVRVRALGVQPPGACYGEQATAFASRVLARRAVTLVAGPGRAADRFDRRLATVTLDGGGDYAVLAAEAGIARAYAADAAPEAMPAVRAAQDRARLAERGVWGAPCRGAEAARDTPSAGSTARSSTATSSTATSRTTASTAAGSGAARGGAAGVDGS